MTNLGKIVGKSYEVSKIGLQSRRYSHGTVGNYFTRPTFSVFGVFVLLFIKCMCVYCSDVNKTKIKS